VFDIKLISIRSSLVTALRQFGHGSTKARLRVETYNHFPRQKQENGQLDNPNFLENHVRGIGGFRTRSKSMVRFLALALLGRINQVAPVVVVLLTAKAV
jgi:hypothetical protein